MPVRGSIEINELYCKGCELCVAACPQHGIALAMDYLTPRGYHPARLVTDACTGCEICGIVCPDAAITVYREPPARKAQKSSPVIATVETGEVAK